MDNFEKLLFKFRRVPDTKDRLIEGFDGEDYKEINQILAVLDAEDAQDIITELGEIDITSLDDDEYAELINVLSDTAVPLSNVEYISKFDFDIDVDNGNDTFLSEKPAAKMKTANMDRTKHKMSANAIPKSKLKAARIKNRLKNFKQRLKQKKYYKQNKAALKRYSKSYNTAVKTGRHKVAIRRKS